MLKIKKKVITSKKETLLPRPIKLPKKGGEAIETEMAVKKPVEIVTEPTTPSSPVKVKKPKSTKIVDVNGEKKNQPKNKPMIKPK